MLPRNETLHSSRNVVGSPNVKRRISVQSTKNPEQSEESHQLAKAIGILGIKTSFLDKYKLQSMNDEDNFETNDG